MQKLLSNGPLLNDKGELCECGYSTSLIKNYDRNKIKGGKLRIKEWDYYLIYNNNFGVAITVDDNSYMGLNSFTIIDFSKPYEITKSPMTFMPLGKTNFPSSSKIGDVVVKKKNYSFEILNDGSTRKINVYIKNFKNKKDIRANFKLTEEPKDSMVIATPFKEKKTAFYYNQKTIGFKVSGKVFFGDDEIVFNKKDTYGLLDWGRGVWTYSNTWYWGAAMGKINNKDIGFNIGYGFGDTTAATENMVFIDGIAHKLDQVTFNIPKDKYGNDDFLKPWTFTSNDGRFEMNFNPIIDRHSNANVLIISSNQHQVFGKFSGTIVLDNGNKITVNNLLGFAEKVVNKW